MMKPHQRAALLTGAICAALAEGASAGDITPELAQELTRRAPGEPIAVIIQMADRVDLRQFAVQDRRRRDTALMRALRAKSALSLKSISAWLELAGASERKPLWIVNALAATLPAGAIATLARLPGVARIQYDAVVRFSAQPATPVSAGSTGWNLEAIHVPAVWDLGQTGAGVVVANMDTGVDLGHPDLEQRWRGGGNSWFDPYAQHQLPYDPNGHGTQTMGLIVGGAGGGSAVGVAPGARWIAAKIFNDAGQGTLSGIHLAFQWLLDPDGDPATTDAPDVVNASWGLTGGPVGSCNMEFNEDILALNAAGTVVVFAAGNDGPAPGTGSSPASNPAAFPVGALDQALVVSGESSRGPSACDGAIFPKVVAPGVNVTSTDLSFGGLPLYAMVSGTSFAAPHVSGIMALLASAFPAASVDALRDAVTGSAADLDAPGADNTFGHGLVDAVAAHGKLSGGANTEHSPVITSTPVTAAAEAKLYRYQMSASDADGGTLAYALASGPAGMMVDPGSGLVTWTPTHDQVGANPVSVTVTDPTARVGSQTFSVQVAANSAPVAMADSYSAVSGVALTVAAPGVLANDRDADADVLTAQLVSGPAHGTLNMGSDGAFRYQSNAGFAGSDGFSYRAADGKTSGNTVNVAVNVSAPAPVAVNDSFGAPVYRSSPYQARRFAVLGNDRAPGATIVPASITLVSAPSRGGKATTNSDGTVSYTPPLRFSGTETFSYKFKDSRNTWSNLATVTVTVK